MQTTTTNIMKNWKGTSLEKTRGGHVNSISERISVVFMMTNGLLISRQNVGLWDYV
jgi:hypothetical protein